MLNLIFAPSADILVPLTADKIRQAWDDPFDPPTVIVPNPAVGKWLKIQLAKPPMFGCVANERMATLEKFLWNALGGGPDMKLITADHLSQIVCAVLNDELLADKIYAPLKNYLHKSNGQIDALKRVQLSIKIASQFLEYEYNRPSVWNEAAQTWKHGIDANWLCGKTYFGGQDHEAWQMDLYRRVNNCLPKDNALTTLPHLYRHTREKRAKENRPWCDIGGNKQIILFGVSKISHFHRNTLVEISQTDGVDMHVFLTNPCAEFWEDVDTSRRTPRRKWRHDSPDHEAGIKPVKPDDYDKPTLGMFANERDHTLLKLWGGAGKENIFLWCPQAQWNFEFFCDDNFDIGHDDTSGESHDENCSIDRDDMRGDSHVNNSIDDNSQSDTRQSSTQKTLLSSIQKSLLSRKNDLQISSENFIDDGSIQILACPDISREVEEVREMILDMAHAKQIDTFNDVAVYMPDTSKYLPHIQRVFGAYPQNHHEYIPYNILGASSGVSWCAQAMFALLDILGGQYNRARIFELLRNPIVWSSKEISPDDVDMWEEWTEKYGMFRGYDAEHRKNMGDIGGAAANIHTFKHGMEKVFADIENEERANIANDNNGVSLMTNDSALSTKKESAEIFLSLLTELYNLSARFINKNDAINIRESVQTLIGAAWSWLGNIAGDGLVNSAAESRVRQDAVGGFERILLQCDFANRNFMPSDEFIALARNCVSKDTAVASSAWNGVTFAPLRAATVLPHRVLFAMGFGADDFPGVNESGSWNLLIGKRNVGAQTKSNRIVGDSDTVRDNRFAFLELVHAAKEKLILSYRARNMQKDEQLQPSSVVMEFENYLIGQGLTHEKNGAVKSSVRYEIPWVTHESLDRAAVRGRKHGTWDKTQRELAKLSSAPINTRAKHRSELSAQTQNILPQTNVDTNQYITMNSDIKLFLSNPLEYHLRKTLNVKEDNRGGDMSAIDEPMESGNMYVADMRKNVWAATLNSALSSDMNVDGLTRFAITVADDIYSKHVDSGQAPEGYVCDMEKNELAAWSQLCAEEAIALREIFPAHQVVNEYTFTYDCDPYIINANYARMILPKDTSDKSQKIGVVAFAKDEKIGGNLNLWIDGALCWLYEIKSGEPRDITLVQLDRGAKPKIHTSRMKMDADKFSGMENWLREILTQMLVENRREHLPFKTVANIKGELTHSVYKKNLADYKTFTDGFQLTDANAITVSDEVLREIVNSRYAPMIGRLIHE